MRTPARLALAVLSLALAVRAAPARAGGIAEFSAGVGYRVSPSPDERTPTNLMLAGGLKLTDLLRAELGAVGNLADTKGAKFDLDLRGMVVVAPPLFPVYGRGIIGVTSLLEGPTAMNYGGALGVSIGALGVGAFLEAGAISRKVNLPDAAGTGTTKKDTWIAEGRLGIYFK
jgi:hypothetical protein